MTTDKGLRWIPFTSLLLALALLFGFTVIARGDDHTSVPPSTDMPAKNLQPQTRDAAAKYAEAITEFVPRSGKHVIKVKRGWSGYLVFSKVIQDVHWTIVGTQNIGAAYSKVTDASGSNWRNVQFEPPAGERRVRVLPRNAATTFNVRSYESNNTTPPEQVTLISEGVNIIVDRGPDGGGAIDVSADRVVVWTDASKTERFSPEMPLLPEQPLQLYLEGNVVIRQHSEQPQPSNSANNNVIRATQAFYDARENRVLVSKVELKTSILLGDETFLSRANEVRQDLPKARNVIAQGSQPLANELPLLFPSDDPVLKAVTLDEFSRFVAVRRGTAMIRYHGLGATGNSHCDLQIEVEADTSEIDAALKEAIPQSQIKVTEIRSAALLTGTVPTDLDRLQADNIARQFYRDVITQLNVATVQPAPPEPPAPLAKPQRERSSKADKISSPKTKPGVRAELKELRGEVQALRQDIRELNELLVKRAVSHDRPRVEPPKNLVPKQADALQNGLLCFEAGWCGPCQKMKPIVEKMRKDGRPIQSIDVDTHPDLCREFNVESIPCFVLVKEGREIDRAVGIATEADLEKLLGRFDIVRPDEHVPLSMNQLPRELSLNVGTTKVLAFDHPVSIVKSNPELVVIEHESPKRVRIRAKTVGEVELQLVYHNTGKSERILVRVVDDHLAKALSKTIALNIDNQPLTEILREFERQVDANIHLDTKGLAEEGVSPDTKHSIVVTGLSARSALKLILNPLHLDFIEDNEVIRVTSRDRANGELYVMVYNVKDLVESEEGRKATTTGLQLVDLLQQVGDREAWDAGGGPGSVRYRDHTRSLIVRQTYSMHHRIADFLADRRRSKVPEKEVIRGDRNDDQANRFIEQRLGVVVVPLSQAEGSKLPTSRELDGKTTHWHGGLRVTKVTKPHVFKEGDVIVGIDSVGVGTLSELALALHRVEKTAESGWPRDQRTGDPLWPNERGVVAPDQKRKYRSQIDGSMKFHMVRDGEVQYGYITLRDATQRHDPTEFVVKVYSVADLVPVAVAPISDPSKPDWFRLIDHIMADVEPTCWKSNGGPCSISTNEQTLSLVIRAPQHIQDQVTTLLDRERRKMDVQVCFEVRMIAASEKALDQTGIDLSRKTDPEANCALLDATQRKIILDAFGTSGAEMQFAPKVTVFNGHAAYLRSQAWPMKDGTVIDVETHLRGLVAPDRRSVGVNLALNADKVVEELTRRTINVADGSSLLLDVTEELRAKNPKKAITGRAYMLVEPRVLVVEEEIERLDAAKQDRDFPQTPRDGE